MGGRSSGDPYSVAAARAVDRGPLRCLRALATPASSAMKACIFFSFLFRAVWCDPMYSKAFIS